MFVRLLRALSARRERASLNPQPDLRRAQQLIRTQRAADRLAVFVVAAATIAVSVPLALRPTAAALTVGAITGGMGAAAAAALVVVQSHRRDLALAAIADGDDDLPLPGVASVRHRLLDPAHVAALAASLRYWGTPAHGWSNVHPATRLHVRPPLDPAAAHLLDALSGRLLVHPPLPARAVAVCELLLAAPDTPLFGRDRIALRRELLRIHDLVNAE
jgi:hypothetical protein